MSKNNATNTLTIGILTSGGDSPGMNATVRAAVRSCLASGIRPIGIRKGYAGLVAGDWGELDSRSVSGILQRGGTVLQTARCPEFREAPVRSQAIDHCRQAGIDALLVIGGDGSLAGAAALDREGLPTVGIPASIDNDIWGTEMALGVDTALNNIVYAVDCIKDTATSHARAFVIEVMGRNSGYLATMAAVATGAEVALVPETAFDLQQLALALQARHDEGRDNAIIMVAEGAASGQQVADAIKDTIGFETRVTVLGHYQRGGSPSAFDRTIGSRFGVAGIQALAAGTSGVMVGLQKGELVQVPFADLVGRRKALDPTALALTAVLGL